MVREEKVKPLPIVEREVPIMTIEAASRWERSEDNTYWGTSQKWRNLGAY